jgi:hypothetical protein
MRTVFLCVAAMAMAVPAAAEAATVSVAGGTLTYTGEPGRRTALTVMLVDPAVPTTVRLLRTVSPLFPPENDTDPIAGPGCSPDGGFDPGVAFVCPSVSRATFAAGDGEDAITVTEFAGPVTLSGGAGDDSLSAGPGSATLDGGDGADWLNGGAGHDLLQGAEGDDSLDGGGGSDRLRGGPGFDVGSHHTVVDDAAVAITLDDVADDGEPGERDDFGTDIEDLSVYGSFAGSVFTYPRAVPRITITGSALANTITTDTGADTVTGGAGSDTISTLAGDDTVHARDGYPDRISCGPGTDTVTADALDAFSGCENVQVGAVTSVIEDAPPTIAWSTPAPTKALKANDVTVLEATASDDRGVSAVRFLDDERLVCEDTTAPYTCGYQARDEDVGRNTLTLVAVDGAGQTASAQRAVVVSRFKPVLSLGVDPARDRHGPYRFSARGRVVRPATVHRRAGCSGRVTLTVKDGRRTVATRRLRLSKRCTYGADLRFARAYGALRVSARFGGNAVFLAGGSPTRTIRTG